jgi:hypothetical protein
MRPKKLPARDCNARAGRKKLKVRERYFCGSMEPSA